MPVQTQYVHYSGPPPTSSTSTTNASASVASTSTASPKTTNAQPGKNASQSASVSTSGGVGSSHNPKSPRPAAASTSSKAGSTKKNLPPPPVVNASAPLVPSVGGAFGIIPISIFPPFPAPHSHHTPYQAQQQQHLQAQSHPSQTQPHTLTQGHARLNLHSIPHLNSFQSTGSHLNPFSVAGPSSSAGSKIVPFSLPQFPPSAPPSGSGVAQGTNAPPPVASASSLSKSSVPGTGQIVFANQTHTQSATSSTQAQPTTNGSSSGTKEAVTNGAAGQAPLIATGDWTKDLIHLAKTAELKKHALTLQLHTAHILSAQAQLEQKAREIMDLDGRKRKLDTERNELLEKLRQVNEERDQADLSIATCEKESTTLRQKIVSLTEGEYAVAKKDVDRLREELGQSPLPSIRDTLVEKTNEASFSGRLSLTNGPTPSTSLSASGTKTATIINGNTSTSAPPPKLPSTGMSTTPATIDLSKQILTTGHNPSQANSSSPPRATLTSMSNMVNGIGGMTSTLDSVTGEPAVKRARGRPKGSRNKPKSTGGGGDAMVEG